MLWFKRLVRQDLLELKPYTSARDDYSGSAPIKLDACEMPYPPYGQGNFDVPINRYPEPQPPSLKQKLSEIYKVNSDQVFITRGIGEGIDILIRAICNPFTDSILINTPTFGYYAIAAQINGALVINIPLLEEQNFALNLNEIQNSAHSAKIIFLCSPNNPTGNVIPLETIKHLCQSTLQRSLVLVDEAYVEFSDQESAVRLLPECENLIVMRTLSKAYALAGIRIGVNVVEEPITRTPPQLDRNVPY